MVHKWLSCFKKSVIANYLCKLTQQSIRPLQVNGMDAISKKLLVMGKNMGLCLYKVSVLVVMSIMINTTLF